MLTSAAESSVFFQPTMYVSSSPTCAVPAAEPSGPATLFSGT